ncbi:hypothetical protein [Kitasatospora sp. NPDC057223]|uniref:hypothetical protein n=1 Tax=Kitasatospora sp. NPDC057223 TaxID=3346055 RepID=UPI00363D8FE6
MQDTVGFCHHVGPAVGGLGEQGGHRALRGRREELPQPGGLALVLCRPLGDAVIGVAGDDQVQEAQAEAVGEVGERRGTGQGHLRAGAAQGGAEHAQGCSVGSERRADHHDPGHRVLLGIPAGAGRRLPLR